MPQQIALEILKLLSDSKPINSRQLSQRLGYSQNYIKQIASEMVKLRLISSTPRGYIARTTAIPTECYANAAKANSLSQSYFAWDRANQ